MTESKNAIGRVEVNYIADLAFAKSLAEAMRAGRGIPASGYGIELVQKLKALLSEILAVPYFVEHHKRHWVKLRANSPWSPDLNDALTYMHQIFKANKVEHGIRHIIEHPYTITIVLESDKFEWSDAPEQPNDETELVPPTVAGGSELLSDILSETTPSDRHETESEAPLDDIGA
jgi:hypothetical protein